MAERAEREPKRRTKTGCLTCRKRRVRCDELHPVCSACIRLKLDCVYPTPQPHLPHNLGRPPQTTDRPRPGRPRLSASTQSADRPRIGKARQSTTPTRERRRQTEGGFAIQAEDDDTDMTDMGSTERSGSTMFPGLVKGKNKRTASAMASSSAGPNTPVADAPWFLSTNGAASVPGISSGPNGESSREFPAQRLSDLAVRKHESNGTKSASGLSGTKEAADHATWFSSGQNPATILTDKTKRTVTITAEDQEPFQHFVSTMVRFCQLRNSTEDNLYSYILTTMGLFHECLFNAMMAWSSLHLAHLRSKSMRDAEDRHDHAVQLLQEDSTNGTHIDVILATMWFLLEYERLMAGGVDKVRKLLDHAADAIEVELGNKVASLSRIGPIGSIVLVWMSALDCQAAHFGGAGRILGQLQMYPHITKFIETSAVTEDTPMSKDWSVAPSVQTEETKQLQACMRLNLRTIILTGQIILLGRWQATAPGTASWAAVNTGLETLEKEVEEDKSLPAIDALSIAKGGAFTAAPALSALGYNRLLLLASYYAAIILYQQFQPSVAQDGDLSNVTEECAARIIRISLRITREQPNSPPAMMNTLFIAATVIKDQIYQAWSISMFEKAERWGSNMAKARKLLESIIDRQNRVGSRVDFVEIMKESTGHFIL
ncbi:C6 zinc finger domain-containing protein [Phlyctema vagabunda]|uniref:C6 zinc finger domain-containing protein n=1 Tax=Phlyctema vagabunda TaxID=108571 RepID=A0ABR4PNX2_9HELO